MSDCSNIEIREALPELLHGRLDAIQAAKVREHVARCAECAAELELLERVQRLYSATPAVNTAAIVAALPRPRTRRAFSLGMLRAAAAIVVLLAGALVFRAAMSGSENGKNSQVVVTPDTPAVTVQRDTPVTVGRVAQPRVLAMSLSELDDLDADEMESLLSALDRLDGAPVAEPDTLMGSVSGIGT
ncbi:MAG TPA: zf-HC2 domain-containing protein [Gemmatimonadaceae bacterium]|nr:zf-HC2 domain-containing protein [Gemmatimonadaceae bacterium]